mgnify:CR=1 FL=1
MHMYINQLGSAKIRSLPILIPFSCSLMILMFSMAFVVSYDNVISRYEGPLLFGLSVFLSLGVSLFILLLFSYIHINKYPLISLILIFSSFLLKYAMPYYVFEGYVNYDTPIHYLSALYLRDYRLSLGYHYHSWPSSLFLVDILNTIAELDFPIDYSLVALTSRLLIPLTIYSVSKWLLASSRSILIAMAILLVFEPFIIHPCPQITAVALTIIAIVVFLNWLHMYERKWLYILIILGISIVTYHAVIPIAFALSILAVLALFDLALRLDLIKASTSTRYGSSQAWLAVIVLIAVTFSYNIYTAPFMIKSIVRALTSIPLGGARLDTYPLLIESPKLRWQYDIIANIRRGALLLLLGIPLVIIALSLLAKYFMSKLSIVERVFFAITVIAGANALIHIVFNVVLNMGIVERFYQIFLILAPILTAYLYENVSNNSPRKSSILNVGRVLSSIVLTSAFIFTPLSMFTSPSYTGLYISAFGKPDLNAAQWMAEHLSAPEVHLDGSCRLNHLIALYLYPNNVYKVNLSITRHVEAKALKEDYSYPLGTIITTRKPLSTGTSIVKGLSDVILDKYIEGIPSYLDKLFSNGVCKVFIRR